MAFLPLSFETHPEFTTLPRSRSTMSPGRQTNPMMLPLREGTSPHGQRHRQNPPGTRDRRSPTSPTQTSMRTCYPIDYPGSVMSNHMTNGDLYSMPASPRPRHQPSPDRRSPGSVPPRRRRSPDHITLLAMGSWSSQSIHDDDPYARPGRERSINSIHDGDFSAKNAPYDDFILFPDDATADTHEDFTACAESSLAPRAPRFTRLRTPDFAPLSTDVQFFPCLGDEAEQDRINEAWYIAGRDGVNSKLDGALAYMAVVEGRRRTLRE
ncbi:hypothetical protein CORC01_03134 [Colletotrichum orchidophilum]|uniref:Uncharacterized protein n=1 Tax=Colletotrichum orchidophilum TaxID=1209926 RepID=A0A1G4BJP1_9PEZI|nr:uncharacterized protein CORC01_03134 [Colletotrichum orchidophilum]OHF01644.1 hypothetical protein CORC01_03134 [Colletotrichum orchidophilum]